MDMEKKKLYIYGGIVAGIFFFACLVGVIIIAYFFFHRYTITDVGKGLVYKTDRWTGRTVMIYGDKEQKVLTEEEARVQAEGEKIVDDVTKDKDNEEKAINLVKNQYGSILNGVLNNSKEAFTITGWQAKKVEEETYLVSYTYKTEKCPEGYGWFYEVHLKAGIIRNITGNEALEKKYGFGKYCNNVKPVDITDILKEFKNTQKK